MKPTVSSEVITPLNVENGLSNPASEQRTLSKDRGSGRSKLNVGRCRWKHTKKATAIAIVIAVLVVSLVISAGYNISCHAQTKQLEVTSTSKPFLTTSCPRGWITNAESCYCFSDSDSSWDSSYRNCSSYGASLLTMATPQEMAFINKNKAPDEYWLGLRRKSIGEPWKQPDGSDFEAWFEIKGMGLCASLNDGVVSSTDCDGHRRWICHRPRHAV